MVYYWGIERTMQSLLVNTTRQNNDSFRQVSFQQCLYSRGHDPFIAGCTCIAQFK